jgi:hypothetical protein
MVHTARLGRTVSHFLLPLLALLLLPLLLLAPACTPVLDDDDASDDDDITSADDDDSGDDDDAAGDDDDATGDDDDSTTTADSCANVGGTSNLAGVCIRFDAQDGLTSLKQAAAGISIPYTVIVEDDAVVVVPLPQDAGSCDAPGTSGLILFERLTGNGESYCICDQGLCIGPDMTPRTIAAGSTARTFDWTGRNWSGPSDTGFPLGDPFPAGIYTLEVSAVAAALNKEFTVSNTFLITLSE